MNETTQVLPKTKKSVALSGIVAGNTELCSVGHSGNDLHYRGYDILDLAPHSEFEEIAFLLVHGRLPNPRELAAYRTQLRGLRGVPAGVRTVLEALPAAAHPMDVMRTGVSASGCTLPEKGDHTSAGARLIADRLMASLGSMLLIWYHWTTNGKRIDVETDDDCIGGHFLHLHADVVALKGRRRFGDGEAPAPFPSALVAWGADDALRDGLRRIFPEAWHVSRS